MRERGGRLMFLLEPCEFNQDAARPAVSGLGNSLATCHRSAVVGTCCQAEIGSQLLLVGEGSGEHFASQYRRTCTADTLKCRHHLPLPFDRRVLRVGHIPFLLSLMELGLDQLEALILWVQARDAGVREADDLRRWSGHQNRGVDAAGSARSLGCLLRRAIL